MNRTIEIEDYSLIADEYYDSSRHPTCWDFRTASKTLATSWCRTLPSRSDMFLDIGAGSSVFAEVLGENRSLHNLIILDNAPGMLAHSLRHSEKGATLVIGDATNLPIASRRRGYRHNNRFSGSVCNGVARVRLDCR